MKINPYLNFDGNCIVKKPSTFTNRYSAKSLCRSVILTKSPHNKVYHLCPKNLRKESYMFHYKLEKQY
ncbi:hypothetical protein SAMN05444349_13213 [Bacteroides faecichinchillae]|uniref:Uncharacterized protein n=1 Tax=Bacteroides faecichinchillae TaxID=871325 RepID=A0A1M5E2E7_9BACE|nr:hypothetical protein SAMN05444349_13213 [Bacteroides faecichinchillae]